MATMSWRWFNPRSSCKQEVNYQQNRLGISSHVPFFRKEKSSLTHCSWQVGHLLISLISTTAIYLLYLLISHLLISHILISHWLDQPVCTPMSGKEKWLIMIGVGYLTLITWEPAHIRGEWMPEQDQASTSREDRQERLRVRPLRVPATGWDLCKKSCACACSCLFREWMGKVETEAEQIPSLGGGWAVVEYSWLLSSLTM